MVVVNGLELKGTVGAVDLVDELRNLGGQSRRVPRAGRSDLDKNNLLRPLRVVVEEALKSAELL